MKLPQPPHRLLLILLPFFTPTVLCQGTVTLVLATTNEETSTTLTVPFNTLFDASSSQKGVSIQVSNGDDVTIADNDILCQRFSDTAGTQPLGESFDNVFPGVEFATEPTRIGSILCSDSAGLKARLASAGSGAGNADENQAQAPPAETTATAAAPAVITTQPPPPATTSTNTSPSTTAATSSLATSTAALNNNNNNNNNAPPTSSPPANANETPTASLKFALSSDPSDDSSTQLSVPIDSSVVKTTGLAKTAKSVTVVAFSAANGGSLVCQAFADTEAKVPVQGGFGVDAERVLGGGGVGSVGCAVVGGGGFGGWVGLVGK